MISETRAVLLAAIIMTTIELPLMGIANTAAADGLTQKQSSLVQASERVPLCVEKAEQPSETIALAKFQTSHSSRLQADIVRTSGWATLQGMSPPGNGLINKCAVELRKLVRDWLNTGTVQSAAFSQSHSAPPKMWKPASDR
jgi:hypothetical protein